MITKDEAKEIAENTRHLDFESGQKLAHDKYVENEIKKACRAGSFSNSIYPLGDMPEQFSPLIDDRESILEGFKFELERLGFTVEISYGRWLANTFIKISWNC